MCYNNAIMKRYIITGATGLLGCHLINEFLKDGNSTIIAVLGRHGIRSASFPKSEHLVIITCDELFTKKFDHIDALIHTAFARGEDYSGLAASVEMTRRVIEVVNRENIDSFVNISSQGVYKGTSRGEMVNENGLVEPCSAYGLMKWSVENMIKLGCKKPYTNLRMASLSSNARFLVSFVNKVKSSKDILVTAPNQFVSIMDVADATSGIKSVVLSSYKDWFEEYNLGPETQYSILDLAEITNSIGCELGYEGVEVQVEDNGTNYSICMDCHRIQSQTGWKPRTSIDTVVRHLFRKDE